MTSNSILAITIKLGHSKTLPYVSNPYICRKNALPPETRGSTNRVYFSSIKKVHNLIQSDPVCMTPQVQDGDDQILFGIVPYTVQTDCLGESV